MAKLGVLFDIDALGSGLYSHAAYKIFFSKIDPRRLSGCSLYNGNTNSTVKDGTNYYCIAVESSDVKVLDIVRDLLTECKIMHIPEQGDQ